MPVSEGKSARIPEGLRIYAIGDIHGRLDLLKILVDMIEAHEVIGIPSRTVLVFLGDYIDRGPESRGVIEFLVNWRPQKLEAVFLRGNHEDMLVHSFSKPEVFELWALNGGAATAHSYGVSFDPHNRSEASASAIIAQLSAAMPQSHRAFLENLPIGVEIGDYLFVHAGVRPGVPLNQQSESDCLFIRDEFLKFRGDFGKIVVHGHTPAVEPEVLPNRIGIDTGAVFTGRLTALCLEGDRRAFLTTGPTRWF
jgi:serine/threonine protein phosphatase 1